MLMYGSFAISVDRAAVIYTFHQQQLLLLPALPCAQPDIHLTAPQPACNNEHGRCMQQMHQQLEYSTTAAMAADAATMVLLVSGIAYQASHLQTPDKIAHQGPQT
jgi:hypothetical protein